MAEKGEFRRNFEMIENLKMKVPETEGRCVALACYAGIRDRPLDSLSQSSLSVVADPNELTPMLSVKLVEQPATHCARTGDRRRGST